MLTGTLRAIVNKPNYEIFNTPFIGDIKAIKKLNILSFSNKMFQIFKLWDYMVCSS